MSVRTRAVLSSGVALRASELTVARGRRVLVQRLDLELTAGEVLHVVGDNGCGKSSLLRVLAGDVDPRRGSVQRVARWAYVPERMALPDSLTARRWLGMLGAGDAELPHELDRRCDALSKGQLQRLALTGALHRPVGLVVLDEPWSGLDAPARGWLEHELSAAAERGAAVVFTDHGGSSALTASSRLVIDGGVAHRERVAAAPLGLHAHVVLVRGGERRVDRVDVAARDQFLTQALADGWGVERVEPCA